MKTLPTLLKWTSDTSTLILKVNSNGLYLPYDGKDSLFEECKRNKYLQFSYEYLMNYCGCEVVE